MLQFMPMLIALPLLGFWFWMLNDLAKNEYLTKESRNTWFVTFILFNFFAALWYYYVEYRNRNL